jgi:hypothetical protein
MSFMRRQNTADQTGRQLNPANAFMRIILLFSINYACFPVFLIPLLRREYHYHYN